MPWSAFKVAKTIEFKEYLQRKLYLIYLKNQSTNGNFIGCFTSFYFYWACPFFKSIVENVILAKYKYMCIK